MFWRKKLHPLDKVLFHWDASNHLTVRNLLAGGIHAFGRTDAGKSSSMVQIARSILHYGNSSMLVLCAKRDEYRDWVREARAAGREQDVVVIDPTQPWRFNMFGYESGRAGVGAGIAQNVVRFIMELRGVVLRESDQEGGESQQWKKQDERLLTHAITLLQLAGEALTPANLHALILDAPQAPTQMTSPDWQKGYFSQCLECAFDHPKTRIAAHDFEQAADYFTREWVSLADKTRSSILVGTMATLMVCNSGIAHELFAERTNITPRDAIEGCKIVIVNMPPDEWGDLGAIANIGFKYHWQKDVLRREITDHSPIACIWGDESSLWATPADADYLSRCRSYRGCMVYICQSRNNYLQAIPGSKAEAAVESMLANFSHKLFFALGDFLTAEWASNLCGKELRAFAGGGTQYGQYEPLALFPQQSQHSSSFQEQYEYLVQPSEFMNGMRTGSPLNGYMVDAILVRSGVPFSNGTPLLNVAFDQRR